MPVVWCVGADGHNGMELSHVGGRHVDIAALSDPSAEAREASFAQEAQPGDCLDRQLLDKSKASAPTIDGIVSFDLRAFVLLPLFVPTGVSAPSIGWRERALAPPDPVRDAIRSVVLLI